MAERIAELEQKLADAELENRELRQQVRQELLQETRQAQAAAGQAQAAAENAAREIQLMLQEARAQNVPLAPQAQAQIAPPAQPVERAGQAKINLKTFRGGDRAYARFEQSCRHAIMANRWNLNTAIPAVLAALDGSAADSAATLSGDPAMYNNNLDTFFNTLRMMFVSSAHEVVAKNRFESRVQGVKEDIRTYSNELFGLWLDAFSRQEEPWRYPPLHGGEAVPVPEGVDQNERPGFRSKRLIEHFLSGIRDKAVRIMIKNSLRIQPIQTYQDALDRATGFTASEEQAEVEEARIRQGTALQKRWENYTPNTGKKEEGPEPMDLGAFKKREERKENSSGQVGQRFCRYHGNCNHTSDYCRVLKENPKAWNPDRKTSGSQSSNVNRLSQRPPQQKGQDGEKKKNGREVQFICKNCGGKGHAAKVCPSAPAQKKGNLHLLQKEEEEEKWETGSDSDDCQGNE